MQVVCKQYANECTNPPLHEREVLHHKQDGSVDDRPQQQRENERPDVTEHVGKLLKSEGSRHLLQRTVGVEIHHGPCQAVARGRQGNQIHLQDLAVPVLRQSTHVDDDGVHDEHGEGQEEVEAEERDVGGGWRVEEQREAVHPWGDGDPVGHQEEEEHWEDLRCSKVDVLGRGEGEGLGSGLGLGLGSGLGLGLGLALGLGLGLALGLGLGLGSGLGGRVRVRVRVRVRGEGPSQSKGLPTAWSGTHNGPPGC